MDQMQARQMVLDLRAVGVTFGWRAFWLANGATISSSVDLVTTPPGDWGAELLATFPDVPEIDPNFKFLDAVRDLYQTSDKFRETLHLAAESLIQAEDERRHDEAEQQADEAMAAMDLQATQEDHRDS